MKDALQHALDVLSGFLAENPLVGAWYTTVVRFVFPLLALMILVGAIRSLWKVKHPDEVWGYLTLGNGVRLPLTHWENIIGRAAACDVQLEYPSVSRQHAALIRENDGSWTVYDLNSKGGIKVNDLPVDEYAIVEDGDTVSFGGIPTTMVPISAEEKRWQMAERREEGRPAGMWGSLVLLTLFVVLNLINSRSGRAIMASRDNRIAAEAMGVNVTKYKLMAFVTSAALAGMAGALFGLNFSSIAPDKFKFDTSILVLVFVVLGGIGNIRGSVIAAALLTVLPEVLREFGDYRMLIYAIVLIAVMLLGNAPVVRQVLERIRPAKKEVVKEGDAA